MDAAAIAPLAALAARPMAAVLVVVWASGVLPPLAGLAVAAAVALFTAPLALGDASSLLGLGGAGAAALGALDQLRRLSPAAVIAEAVRGGMLGLAAVAPLWAARTAGLWAGQRWRLGAASSASPVAALYAAMLGVAFVAVDGPVLVCAAIARSYQAAPLGSALAIGLFDGGMLASVLSIAFWIATAVRLCLPLLLAVAVAELAVTAATRAGAAAAVAWPSAVLAPALVLLVTAPLVPLLVGALAIALRRGLGG
jgi:type III secretory pathway component EscT